MRYRRPTRSQSPPGRHVLVYDEHCAFCRATARALQRCARPRLELMPLAAVPGSGLLTALDEAAVREAAHYVTPDGQEFHAGESVTHALRLCPGGRAAALLDLPLLWRLRELAYGLAADNRGLLSRLLGVERGEAGGDQGR